MKYVLLTVLWDIALFSFSHKSVARTHKKLYYSDSIFFVKLCVRLLENDLLIICG